MFWQIVTMITQFKEKLEEYRLEVEKLKLDSLFTAPRPVSVEGQRHSPNMILLHIKLQG